MTRKTEKLRYGCDVVDIGGYQCQRNQHCIGNAFTLSDHKRSRCCRKITTSIFDLIVQNKQKLIGIMSTRCIMYRTRCIMHP